MAKRLPVKNHLKRQRSTKDVFISWSGDTGSEVGEVLIEWLGRFMPGKLFFYSPDIERGADWRRRLLDTLGQLNVGVILLTEEALTSHWVMYEAGALAKNAKALIVPVILDIEASRIPGPLDIRNAAFLYDEEKEDKAKKHFLNMVRTIQNKLGIPTTGTNALFARTWSPFFKRVRKILTKGAASRKKEDTGVDLLRHLLSQPSCKNSTLKQDIIRDLILTRAEPKLSNIEHGKIELQALDSVNYVAFNFMSILKSLRSGDEYSAVAPMRFFSGNRMLGGTDKFIKECMVARKNGAKIERYILVDETKVDPGNPQDSFTELKNVVRKYNQELRAAGIKTGFDHTALVFPTTKTYKQAIKDLRGFALVKRGNQLMTMVPDNVKNPPTAKELGKVNIYFDCTPHDGENAKQVDRVSEAMKRARKWASSKLIRTEKLK